MLGKKKEFKAGQLMGNDAGIVHRRTGDVASADCTEGNWATLHMA